VDATSLPRIRPSTSSCSALLTCAALVALVLSSLAMPVPAVASDWVPPRTVFVPDTGHTADGLFLDLWRQHRALIGDPITEEFSARAAWSKSASDGQIVQYYENAALLFLPGESPEDQVQLLPLGREALDRALASTPPAALERAAERTLCLPGMSDCRGFAEVGHTIRGPFREFWESGSGSLFGSPLSEAFRAADDSIAQYFEHGMLRIGRDGTVAPLPLGRIVADRLRLDTTPITPPAGIPPYDPLLFVPPEPGATPQDGAGAWSVGTFGPGPQQGAWKEIVVSISAQAMWAYEGGELVRSSYVSTGTAEVPETTTPIGFWSVLTKYEIQDMEGTISDEYYFVEDVPHILYFDNLGNALHGTYWHSNFGTPMSHGCVNLPLDVAAWMFEWAPIGTAVSVVA
jgi:hypothetical protein